MLLFSYTVETALQDTANLLKSKDAKLRPVAKAIGGRAAFDAVFCYP